LNPERGAEPAAAGKDPRGRWLPQARSHSSVGWSRGVAVAALGVVLGMAVWLRAMGRDLWCREGGLSPWSWDIWSPHNSQHLLDPYSFTHMQHGLVVFAILWLLFRGRRASLSLLLALSAEAAWEVFENTNFVIDSYRESTIALNYYGDSVLNSVADVVAFVLGYCAAAVLPGRVSVTIFLATEAALVWAIRDSLILNVVMLVYPLEAIKAWQMAG